MKSAHRKAHAGIWLVLGFVLPIAFVAILMMRPLGPIEPLAVPLDDRARAVASEDKGSERPWR